MNALHPQFDIRRFRQHLDRLRRALVRVEDCLAYPSMFEVPDAFEVWSVADFKQRRVRDPALMWVDACPAYALALATHAAYGPCPETACPETKGELDAQWDELRGHSNLGWHRAQGIVEDAWRALDALTANAPSAVAASPAASACMPSRIE